MEPPKSFERALINIRLLSFDDLYTLVKYGPIAFLGKGAFGRHRLTADRHGNLLVIKKCASLEELVKEARQMSCMRNIPGV